MDHYLKHTGQQSLMDNSSSTDCSISKEKGSSGCEDCVCCRQRSINSHVKLQLRAHIALGTSVRCVKPGKSD